MNILLTSVGRRSYLVNYFKEALNGEGTVHVANSTALSPAFSVADRHVVSPLIYDKQYIPFLLEYCKTNKIDILISLFDVDLPVLASNKQLFDEIGTRVIVSDKSIVDICNDKWKTFCFLRDKGISTPLLYISLDSALNALSKGEISFPVIIKPRYGMGSIGIFEAENEKELEILYLKCKRRIMNTYLKYESEQMLDKSVLIQEKINGQEYGMDVINDLEGNYQNTIVKMKYAMRSGETDCAIIVDNHKCKELGNKISLYMKHVGNLDVDLFVNDENIYVLEMNARFGGGYPFSHLGGVNLPQAIVNWAMGKEVPENMLLEKVGVVGQKDINIIEIENVQ